MSKNDKLRYLYFWLQAICSLVFPIIILSMKYELFTESVSTGKSVSIIGLVLLLYIVLRLWGDFRNWAKNMKEGFLREFLIAVAKLGPYLLLASLGMFAETLLKDYIFITMTLFVCNALATVFSALHNFYRRKVLISGGAVRVLD